MYLVEVRASDGSNTGTLTVAVTVTNVNEPPAFAAETATRTIAENPEAGVDIGMPVSATDPDAGETLTYSLAGTDAASFGIIAKSGQLQTKDTLDYEIKSTYTVTVTVTDQENVPDTATVTITVTDVGPPAPVTDLAGTFREGNSSIIDLSWTAPTGFDQNGQVIPFPHDSFQPTSYDYCYRETGVPGWTIVQGLTSAEVTITGLTGDSYHLKVRAVNTEGESPWPTDSVTITLSLKPPEVPGTPTLTSRSTDSLSVSWTAPEDNSFTITGYGVQYRKTSETGWEDHSHEDTETSTLIEGLDPATSYQVKVNAVSRGGTSGWSDPPLTASTRSLPPLTASIAAESAAVTEGYGAQFTMTLSRAEAAAVNLSLAYTEGYGDNGTLSAAVPSTGQVTLTVPTRRSASSQGGLITVTINTGNGYQIGADRTASTAIERDPEPPGFAGAPQVQGLTETRIAVAWPEPESDHLQTTGYAVRYREQGQTDWRPWGHNDTSREATITSLRVNTNYEVQVNGTSQAGTGPWSATGTGRTLDLVASMTADSGSVTEGETARFTVTLSRGSFANIWVKLQWTGDFGDVETRTVQGHGQTTARMEIQTRLGSTAGGGQVTAQILQDDAYRLAANDSASIRINRRAQPTPTPTPTPTLTPTPRPTATPMPTPRPTATPTPTPAPTATPRPTPTPTHLP